MSGRILGPDEVGLPIIAAFGFDRRAVISFDLRIRVNEAPVLSVELYVRDESKSEFRLTINKTGDAFETALRRYKLVPIDEPDDGREGRAG
jgi:hypothetical protein